MMWIIYIMLLIGVVLYSFKDQIEQYWWRKEQKAVTEYVHAMNDWYETTKAVAEANDVLSKYIK